MNHKRRRPKKMRFRCQFCRPWKAHNGRLSEKPSIRRAMQDRLARLAPAIWDFIKPREGEL